MIDTCPNCGGEMLTSGYAHRPNCPQIENIYYGGKTYFYPPKTEGMDVSQKLDIIIQLLTKIFNKLDG